MRMKNMDMTRVQDWIAAAFRQGWPNFDIHAKDWLDSRQRCACRSGRVGAPRLPGQEDLQSAYAGAG
jgi:hypothetical protein